MPAPLEVQRPRLGEREPPRAARQQFHPDRVLKLRHALGYRRGRQAERLGGMAEISLLGDFDENGNVVELNFFHARPVWDGDQS